MANDTKESVKDKIDIGRRTQREMSDTSFETTTSLLKLAKKQASDQHAELHLRMPMLLKSHTSRTFTILN